MKLSLALIVAPTKDEARKLNNCLASVAPHVDEVCITITGESEDVEKVAKRHKAKISHIEWEDDFAKARNFNFAQCTGDWILWLDADDILYGGEGLKQQIELAESVAVNGLQMFYEYGHDKNGTVTDGHWKTQLVKNDGSTKWMGAIHEDLIQQRVCKWAQLDRKNFLRIHTATKEENNEHFARNLRILERERDRNPEEPRTYIYLGRTYLGMGQYEEALKVLSQFVTMSGWDEERYEAKCLMGECYEKLGLRKEAYMAYNDAILEDERCPKAYILKARLYVAEEKYEEALTLIHIAKSIPQPKQGIMHMPTLVGRDAYMMASVCCLHLGKYEDAHRLAKLAEKEDKNNKHVHDLLELTGKMLGDEQMTKTFQTLLRWYQTHDKDNVLNLYQIIPSDIKDDPRLLALIPRDRKWDKNSIAIYCGPTAESWLPGSENTKGIGGSETAVIELAKRLTKKGWDITVYNQCDVGADGHVVDGVRYRNYWQFNKEDTFDVLWLWRQPSLLQIPFKARKVILDLHDVPNEAEITPERLKNVDHIFVKTNYHRSLLPNVPDDKFVIVGNGIDLTRFEQEVERNPKKLIYSSSPNRGLEFILDNWATIRKEVPDAELHVFYGWETFYALQKDNPAAMEWMQDMQRKLNQDGIVNHGRVGQKELAKEMLSSSIWFYPTAFPEVHCCTGDTLIEMPRNHKKYPLGVPIKELVGKSGFPVYSYDAENDRITLGTVKWVAKTRKNAEIWRLELDDGTYLEATKDHQIMLRDGTYKELSELQRGESLMPVYMRANFMVKQNNGKWADEHRMVGEWKEQRPLHTKEHVNHIDETRYDNTPEMLEVLSESEHHRKTHKGRKRAEQSIRKSTAAWRKWSQTDAGKQKLSERGKARANKFWGQVFPSWPKSKQQKWIQNRVACKKKKAQEPLHNHKVVSVSNTGRTEDVYDMEVDKYHNFGANGIIIHNCITACEMQAAGVFPITTGYAALAETQVQGIKSEDKEQLVKDVINTLKSPPFDRKHIKKSAKQFSWDEVANTWHNELR